jgi:hypothetical protein
VVRLQKRNETGNAAFRARLTFGCARIGLVTSSAFPVQAAKKFHERRHIFSASGDAEFYTGNVHGKLLIL